MAHGIPAAQARTILAVDQIDLQIPLRGDLRERGQVVFDRSTCSTSPALGLVDPEDFGQFVDGERIAAGEKRFELRLAGARVPQVLILFSNTDLHVLGHGTILTHDATTNTLSVEGVSPSYIAI